MKRMRIEQQNEFYQFKGYEGLYEWSPTTEEARGLKSGKILKWNYDHSGRPFVQLKVDGKYRTFYKAMCIYSHAHQVEIPLGFDVHHINGCWTDNRIENLQMLSHEEHMKLHGKTNEICQKNNTITSKSVIALDEHNNVVYRFGSIQEARRNGFNSGCVSCACRGVYYDCKRDPHCYKGFRWYFEEDWLALQERQQPQPTQQQPTQQLAESTIRVEADGQFYFFA